MLPCGKYCPRAKGLEIKILVNFIHKNLDFHFFFQNCLLYMVVLGVIFNMAL
jgi:hypothetical protein